MNSTLLDQGKLMRKERKQREVLHAGVELTPTHGQVHIPMSTKAAEMCLHATPTVSRAASNHHHMLTPQSSASAQAAVQWAPEQLWQTHTEGELLWGLKQALGCNI